MNSDEFFESSSVLVTPVLLALSLLTVRDELTFDALNDIFFVLLPDSLVLKIYLIRVHETALQCLSALFAGEVLLKLRIADQTIRKRCVTSNILTYIP